MNTKRFLMAALTLILLILTGCGENVKPKELLYYQKYPAEVKLTLTNEENIYSLDVILGEYSENEVLSASTFGRSFSQITVTSPKSIEGVQYFFDSSGTYMSAGDLKIPVSAGVLDGLYPLLRGFRIDTNNLISTDTYIKGAIPLTVAEFRTDDGKITLHLDETGIPVKMIFDGAINFTADIEEYIIPREDSTR